MSNLSRYRAQRSPEHWPLLPRLRAAIYHSRGVSDPLVESDLAHRVNAGLPEILAEWIKYNGLTHFKIKLNGNDIKWDLDRVVGIDRIVNETMRTRDAKDWMYSIDFNEKCPNVVYLLEFCQRLKEQTPAGFAAFNTLSSP